MTVWSHPEHLPPSIRLSTKLRPLNVTEGFYLMEVRLKDLPQGQVHVYYLGFDDIIKSPQLWKFIQRARTSKTGDAEKIRT